MPTTPTTTQQLSGRLTRDQLRQAALTGELRSVLLAVVDTQGRLKGKAYDAEYFVRHFVDGQSEAEMCGYVLATDIEMTPLDGLDLAGWESGFGDVRWLPISRRHGRCRGCPTPLWCLPTPSPRMGTPRCR
ncbi:hypothetical protein E6W39_00040 [Kitasatospora acidiphila]|uniref:Glutamine synthetase n=1 Tax=Kitasatospora acidiphila TaxID=2567942 RepID=A0A540WG45_9ACTN|nr:hypothetical protein [Kitasatospora acidiphila]TQF07996.1 hypothetical protein E6W39_00040 [Kitasatospora acidiphila]